MIRRHLKLKARRLKLLIRCNILDLERNSSYGDGRRHDQKLLKKIFRLDIRKNVFFSNRVIDNWNMLLASCVNYSTINTFKKHLSSELESKTVKFKVCQLW